MLYLQLPTLLIAAGLPVDCEIDEGFMYHPLVGLAKCKLWAC